MTNKSRWDDDQDTVAPTNYELVVYYSINPWLFIIPGVSVQQGTDEWPDNHVEIPELLEAEMYDFYSI